MAKKNEGGGFSQSAGLMRYFDSEDNDKAPKLSPKMVIGIAVAFVAVIVILNVFLPMN
ncbi:MAG: preprotein translocase subunit Sec61beta [Candidatus Methanomethylophilaceae archaeon]|nr:preprotein translocase subunit Sec61beta [Thermoplasmata archaeon]MBQ2763038.1 preprotein translocase subunit Sec61beta [Candidatus Methanomethylophilaceae archaeon]